MPQKCPCPRTNPLAQTVYPLQGGKVHPIFENQKKITEKGPPGVHTCAGFVFVRKTSSAKKKRIILTKTIVFTIGNGEA